MLVARNLTKRFGEIVAVDDISFTINSSEIVGLLGLNGAGKTTTLRMLAGYIPPTAGEIFIYEDAEKHTPPHTSEKGGKYFTDTSHTDFRSQIGYLPEQNPLYPDMIVWDYLKYIAQLKEISTYKIADRILYIASRTGITDKLSDMIGTLSRGYRQRVGIAQAILNDPKILLLDEPTVGLDPLQIIQIRDLIKELGRDRIVLLSSHILSEIQALCDRIVIIHKGKILADTTKENILAETKAQGLEEAFALLTE